MQKTMRLGPLMLAALTGCSSCYDRSQPSPLPRQPRASRPAPSPEPRVRRAVIAGSWYPAEKEKLSAYLDQLLQQAEPMARPQPLRALISPHAGYTFSGKAAASGYKLLRGQPVKRVVVLAVSHQVPFAGASIPEVTHFETPLGLIPVDQEAVARLRRSASVKVVAEAEEREHSLEIQLPLLQRVLPGFQLVPLLIGRLEERDYAELAGVLGQVVDAGTLVVASSDFTHRGSNYSFEVPAGQGTLPERLQQLDQGAIDRILKLDRRGLLDYVKRTGATICGVQPIALLLELLSRQQAAAGQVMARYTSADVSGNWDSTVSYVTIGFSGSWPDARSAGEKVFPLSAEEKRALLQLARRSLEASVRRRSFDPGVLGSLATSSLRRPAGAFVTLKCKHGPGAVCAARGEDLRGCIGTIIPSSAVWDTVARRAASAALEDTRFSPVEEKELGQITVEVSVLTPPRKVKGPEEIVIGRHGIILSKDGQSATFLPQVAPEQGWNRQTTLRHLAQKAGLGPEGWRGADYLVYEAIVFSEAK